MSDYAENAGQDETHKTPSDAYDAENGTYDEQAPCVKPGGGPPKAAPAPWTTLKGK